MLVPEGNQFGVVVEKICKPFHLKAQGTHRRSRREGKPGVLNLNRGKGSSSVACFETGLGSLGGASLQGDGSMPEEYGVPVKKNI